MLLSDTHLPRRARALPTAVLDELPRADVVVHAGDWVDTALLDLLQECSRRLIGVYGNNDARSRASGSRRGVRRPRRAAPGRRPRDRGDAGP